MFHLQCSEWRSFFFFFYNISRYRAPFILFLIQISCPVPFAEKQPQSMLYPPPCFSRYGAPSPSKQRVAFKSKSYILVTSLTHDILLILWIIKMIPGKLQKDLDMCCLNRGDSKILIHDGVACYYGNFCDCAPSSLQGIDHGRASSRVALKTICTPRGEILRGASGRGRLSVIYFFPFL